MNEKILPEHLARAMCWDEAHLDWDMALERVRIGQSDVLEFRRNPNHVSPDFPSGCWSNVPVTPDVDTKLEYPFTYPCT